MDVQTENQTKFNHFESSYNSLLYSFNTHSFKNTNHASPNEVYNSDNLLKAFLLFLESFIQVSSKFFPFEINSNIFSKVSDIFSVICSIQVFVVSSTFEKSNQTAAQTGVNHAQRVTFTHVSISFGNKSLNSANFVSYNFDVIATNGIKLAAHTTTVNSPLFKSTIFLLKLNHNVQLNTQNCIESII
jgi:hypothetical protein